MSATRRLVAVPIVLAFSVASCGSDETADETPLSGAPAVAEPVSEDTVAASLDDYELTSDLAYADEALLDVYSPIQEGPWPVVVFVHGQGGSKNDESIGKGFVTNGAVVYVPTVSSEPPHLETVEQVACAVRYARATGADYGGDPDSIALVGFSMGAAAGAVAALSGDDHTAGCVETEASALPDTFVGYEGPYNWALIETPIGIHLLEEDDPDVWAAVNTYSHIGENPELIVRLIHGVDENLNWFEPDPQVSEDFEEALAEAGYDVQIVLVEGAGHSSGFAGIPQFDEIVTQTLAAADSP